MLKDTDELIIKTGCIYQPRGVICEKKDKCGICGWNPRVSRIRKRLIRMARNEQNKRANPTSVGGC